MHSHLHSAFLRAVPDLADEIADTIALMPDPITRAVYIQATAVRFEIDEHILTNRINKVRMKMIEEERKQARQIFPKRTATTWSCGVPTPPRTSMPTAKSWRITTAAILPGA